MIFLRPSRGHPPYCASSAGSGGEAERSQEPAHSMGFGHGTDDSARSPTARTDEDLDREHPVDIGQATSAICGVASGFGCGLTSQDCRSPCAIHFAGAVRSG